MLEPFSVTEKFDCYQKKVILNLNASFKLSLVF